jgi:tRNA threonylcarbamoyladenosine biosynthesis protein TsaE
MTEFIFHASDETDTERIGAALAELLPDGAMIALEGTLGAGKTRLVQAVARASGVTDQTVTSPTFVLVQEYHGRRPIYHFDAYRIKDDDEFLELGPDEYFDSQGITFVEWAGRVAACLPEDRIEISIEVLGETARGFRVTTIGAGYEELISGLQTILAP